MTVEAIILAGGRGTRLRLPTRKALLDLYGKPLVQHVMESAASVVDRVHVVHAPGMEAELEALAQNTPIKFACHVQREARGTGDALACALDGLEDDAVAISLCADMPLMESDSVGGLIEVLPEQGLAILVTKQLLTSTYGRIIRDDEERVIAIREHADMRPEDMRQPKESDGIQLPQWFVECNTGVLAARVDTDVKSMRSLLDQLKQKLGDAVIVLASVSGDKVNLVAGVTPNRIGQIPAGDLVNHVASAVGGRGGGRADMAQAGGNNPQDLDAALASVPQWVRERLE